MIGQRIVQIYKIQACFDGKRGGVGGSSAVGVCEVSDANIGTRYQCAVALLQKSRIISLCDIAMGIGLGKDLK